MNLNKLLNAVSGSGLSAGLAGGVAGSALTAAITTKGGKKMAKRAMQVGGMAAIGGLAWNAYKAYQSVKANTPSPVGAENATAPKPLEKLSMNDFTTALDINSSPNGGLLIIQTMVSAAMADGHIDKDESKRIFSEIAHKPR